MTPETLLGLMPEVVQRSARLGQNPVLDGLLAAMVGLVEPAEHAHDDLVDWLSPERAPARVLPLLAAWLGVDPRLARTEAGLRRMLHLVCSSCTEGAGSGASSGSDGPEDARLLAALLVAGTDYEGFSVREDPHSPYRLIVQGPCAAQAEQARAMALVAAFAPAHLAFTFEWRDG